MAILKKKPSESGTFNYLGIGLKGDELDDEHYARPSKNIIQTDADDAPNIETETDEGHTGTSTMKVATFRKTADAAPTWTQKLRWSAGLEEIVFSALPNHTVEQVLVPAKGNPEKQVPYYKHSFDLTPVTFDEDGNEVTVDVPLLTLYMAFAKYMNDTRVMNDAALNSLSLEMPAEDDPTLSPTFASNYPNPDTINILRMFRTNIRSRTASPNSGRVFMGRTNVSELEDMTEIECYINAGFELNNNMENVPCHSPVFGKTIKTLGERELTGSIEFPRTEITRYLQSEYEVFERCEKITSGDYVSAHIVSEQNIERQIWYLVEGGEIPYLDYTELDEEDIPKQYNTGIKRRCLFKFPIVNFTSMTHPRSGADAVNITAEWESVAAEGNSIMKCEIYSELPDLQFDDVGVLLEDLIDPEYDESTCAKDDDEPDEETYSITFNIEEWHEDGNLPYPGCKVKDENDQTLGVTDTEGVFVIDNLTNGTYTYHITTPNESDNTEENITINGMNMIRKIVLSPEE